MWACTELKGQVLEQLGGRTMCEGDPGSVPAEALACDEPLRDRPFVVRKQVGGEEVDEVRDVLGGPSYGEISNA